jgi:stage IV sporulation protein FB
MGWESRRYGSGVGDGGGFRQVVRRVFGDGENPLDWSLPLYTAWGIRVRIHLIFVVLIVARLIASMVQTNVGWPFMLMAMGSLFLLVLLHEYGHCAACRWVGGSADRILMWPLGGLASCAPPHAWKPSLVTTLGGPAVNAVLLPVLGGTVWAAAGADAAIFNPFDPLSGLSGLPQPAATWLVALWWLHYTNAVLLAFNMLVPMYPLDGGRVLQELLWRKMGYHRATWVATTVGLGIAATLFVVAMVGGENTLLAVALFGGIVCWYERRRLAVAEPEHPGMTGYDFSRGYDGLPDPEAPPAAGPDRRGQRERAEQERLDAILAKIAAFGMGSLSWRERRWLRRATARRRRG